MSPTRPLFDCRRAVGAAISVAALVMVSASCKVDDPPPISGVWSDDFERKSIGRNYYNTGGGYELKDGALRAKESFNHPLWLRKKLPRNVRVEFDAWSNSPDGDIKVEIYGDGSSHASDKGQYTSSGYVLIMGGWSNSRSILARGNEHGKALAQRDEPKVEPGRRYRWKIERKDGLVEWWVDDQLFLKYDDRKPYFGAGHEYFGFNNWEVDVGFDNLLITPL